jgi:hypothetical protein
MPSTHRMSSPNAKLGAAYPVETIVEGEGITDIEEEEEEDSTDESRRSVSHPPGLYRSFDLLPFRVWTIL